MDTVSTMANGHGILVVAISCGVRFVLTAHVRRVSNRRACRTFKKTAESPEGSVRSGGSLLVQLRSLFIDVPAVRRLPVRRSATRGKGYL